MNRRDHLGDVSVDCINLAQEIVKWRALMNSHELRVL
jgi:hypothetical protein